MARIVVGYDGSTGAERALRWAAEEAVRRGAALELVCSWGQMLTAVPFALDVVAHLQSSMEEAAAEASDLVASEFDLAEVRTRVTPEPAPGALIDASRDADLLVVGSHGHGFLTSLLLGSVSLHCVTHAPCPVVVVPSPLDLDAADRPMFDTPVIDEVAEAQG
jgi:nucleotide-binding universal stress UspA family protein